MRILARIIERGRQRGWRNFFRRDECRFCLGHKGNTPGNENVIAGVVCCDDCSVLVHRIMESAP